MGCLNLKIFPGGPQPQTPLGACAIRRLLFQKSVTIYHRSVPVSSGNEYTDWVHFCNYN